MLTNWFVIIVHPKPSDGIRDTEMGVRQDLVSANFENKHDAYYTGIGNEFINYFHKNWPNKYTDNNAFIDKDDDPDKITQYSYLYAGQHVI